jgi:hypothetical protein
MRNEIAYQILAGTSLFDSKESLKLMVDTKGVMSNIPAVYNRTLLV